MTTLIVVLVVLLCLPIFLWGARGGLLPLLGALIATPVVKLARYGILTAHDGELRFTPYKPRTRDPLLDQAVHAPLSAVRVREGFISRVEWDGMSVQLLPGGREFATQVARAAAAEGAPR